MGNNSGVFKPLPFPTYGTDFGRQRLEKALMAVTAIILCCTFIPGIAGPNASLEVPVQFAILQFPERLPATIELCWDTNGAQIAPASLGYFDAQGRLVYSAAVARGLVYGQSDGGTWVLEIRAPLDGEVFLDPYLDAIREQVVESNTYKNLLMQERLVDLCDGSNPKLDIAWREVAPDLAGSIEPYWPEQVMAKYPQDCLGIVERLGQHARHLASLKELYYGSQQARLRLLVTQFDLQLAMTRYPQHEVSGLAGVGDLEVVQTSMAQELGRLKNAWTLRESTLSNQIASGRHWLDSLTEQPPTWSNPTFSPIAAWPKESNPLPVMLERNWEPNPKQQLEAGLAQALMVVAIAEQQQLQIGLRMLEELEQHVENGVVSTGKLLEFRLDREKFTPLDIEAAVTLPTWERLLAKGSDRLPLLELLASSFFGEAAALTQEGDSELGKLGFDPFPNEVALGLYAIDFWTWQDWDTPDRPKFSSNNLNLPVDQLLDQVIAFPEDYTPESHHLAFLKFVGWYSSLVKAATAQFRSGDRY